MGQEWMEKELAGIDLGDAGLNKRSVTLLDRLADMNRPGFSGAVRFRMLCGW